MKLQIFDSNGTELNINDLLMIQDKRNDGLTFYTRLQVINGALYPLDKFCFDRIIKINELPGDCRHIPAKGTDPEYWMTPRAEIYLIESGKLEKWKHDSLFFESNSFYKVTE